MPLAQWILAQAAPDIGACYTNAQAQYEQMFARGAANARALGLTGSYAGDVLMLEERQVDVPNNSGSTTKQKVLVPIVYLAKL